MTLTLTHQSINTPLIGEELHSPLLTSLQLTLLHRHPLPHGLLTLALTLALILRRHRAARYGFL